jgi:hypothetical protein
MIIVNAEFVDKEGYVVARNSTATEKKKEYNYEEENTCTYLIFHVSSFTIATSAISLFRPRIHNVIFSVISNYLTYDSKKIIILLT